MESWERSFGVIVLATYSPDPKALVRQLLSIQRQEHEDFSCIITADGGDQEIRRIVNDHLLGDARFTVVGYEARLGFYRNFERGLAHVPRAASWVALSDQDDCWYPDKLQKLLPHLANYTLASGQARVVNDATNSLISASTKRRNVNLTELVFRNQITGAFSIFRRELLDIALPFPQNETLELHDHWLGVCAAATGGLFVSEEVVQDYMQHANNALGEASSAYSVTGFMRKLLRLSENDEGRWSLANFLKVGHDTSFGWSRVMIDTLSARLDNPSEEVESAIHAFGTGQTSLATLRAFAEAAKSRKIGRAFLLEFMIGLPQEIRRRSSRAKVAGSSKLVGN